MRILLLICLSIFLSIGVRAQFPPGGGFGSNPGRMIPMTSLGPSENKHDIQGKYLRQEWSPGIVSFRHSIDKWHVPLLFDIYSNKLYFLQDKQVMEFVDSVYEVTMILARKDDSLSVTFRSFYPPINQNTVGTFYEVLVDGQFQLLRCRAKTIYLYKEQDVTEDQRRYNKELLYAYFPGKQMVLIKKDKDQLLAEVPPEFAEIVKSTIESKKLKVKNEESLKQLFRSLNDDGK